MSLITISEYLGCGGKAIAKQVATDLNLELYDDARLQAEAVKMGVRSDEIRGLEEKLPGFFNRLFGKNPEIYLDIMQSVVYKVGQTGQGVIVGHGSQILLREFGCAMHVRVHAPLDRRVSNLLADQEVNPRTAEKFLYKQDQDFQSFFTFAFNLNYNDAALYDLTVNTGKVSVETAAKQIVALAGSDDMKACSLAALESMDRLALEKKVHSELLRQGISLKMILFDVTAPGSVRVYGVTLNADERSKIVDLIQQVPGVSDVQSDIIIEPRAGF